MAPVCHVWDGPFQCHLQWLELSGYSKSWKLEMTDACVNYDWCRTRKNKNRQQQTTSKQTATNNHNHNNNNNNNNNSSNNNNNNSTNNNDNNNHWSLWVSFSLVFSICLFLFVAAVWLLVFAAVAALTSQAILIGSPKAGVTMGGATQRLNLSEHMLPPALYA